MTIASDFLCNSQPLHIPNIYVSRMGAHIEYIYKFLEFYSFKVKGKKGVWGEEGELLSIVFCRRETHP